ncbi:MAG TPA: LapA family protein [Actinomycetota bacterium]|nr:LapA family protein [Actinomycetota bacterium]
MRREGDDSGRPRDPGQEPGQEPVRDTGGGRSEPGKPPRSGISFRQVLIAIVAVILIAFAIANFRTVKVNFLLFDTRARMVTVVVVAAGLGFVIGYFVGRPGRLQRKYLKQRDDDRD